MLKISQSTGLNWVDSLPIALMKMRCERNRTTHLTPHEMLTGRAMPVPVIREGRGPTLETLNREVRLYIKQLSHVHKTIFNEQEKRERLLGRSLQEEERPVRPGDYVYLRVFKRSCLDPRAEGPYKVIKATPRAVRVEGSDLWYHLNSCFRAQRPEGERRDGESRGSTPSDSGTSPGADDDGDEPPGGAGADRSTTRREVQTPGLHPGADLPRVHRVFSPQSVSAGGDPGEPGGEPGEHEGAGPVSTRAEAGSTRAAATPADAGAIPALSRQGGDDSGGSDPEGQQRQGQGQGATTTDPTTSEWWSPDWGEPAGEGGFLSLGDDLQIPDVDQPQDQPHAPGGFLEQLGDPGTPRCNELLEEFFPHLRLNQPGSSQETEGTGEQPLPTEISPELDVSGRERYQYSYAGADWGEYEPSSEEED